MNAVSVVLDAKPLRLPVWLFPSGQPQAFLGHGYAFASPIKCDVVVGLVVEDHMRETVLFAVFERATDCGNRDLLPAVQPTMSNTPVKAVAVLVSVYLQPLRRTVAARPASLHPEYVGVAVTSCTLP